MKKKCWVCEKRMREFIGDTCSQHELFERCVVCKAVKKYNELEEIKGWYFYKCPDCKNPIVRTSN